MLAYAVYAHGAPYFADVLRASCPSGYYPRDGSTLEAFQAAADGSILEAFQAAASEDALAAQAQYYASLGIASSLFTAQATDTQCATLSCCCSDGLSTCFYPLGHYYPLDGFVLEAFQVAVVEHGLAATGVQAAASVDVSLRWRSPFLRFPRLLLRLYGSTCARFFECVDSWANPAVHGSRWLPCLPVHSLPGGHRR